MDPNQTELSGSKEDKAEVVSDPVIFFNRFHASDEYQNAINKFYEGKNLADDVTEEEKREVFEGKEACEVAFIQFAKKSEFKYDTSYYPDDLNESIELYLAHLKDIKKNENHWDRDTIITSDLMRRNYHNNAAEKVVNAGLMPNFLLARKFIQVIARSKRLDSFDSSDETYFQGQKRVLAR